MPDTIDLRNPTTFAETDIVQDPGSTPDGQAVWLPPAAISQGVLPRRVVREGAPRYPQQSIQRRLSGGLSDDHVSVIVQPRFSQSEIPYAP